MSRYPRTPIATKPTRRRSSYLLHHDFVRLDDWCHKVRELVGDTPYHVGSSTQRDGWRDVDLRVIMADDDFDRQYAGQPAKLHYTNQAISAWGREQTGLPIDFQIQRRSTANAKYGGHFRNPMGLRTPASYVTC